MNGVDVSSDDELACRELVELVTEYLDGGLDAAARRRVDAHLADCEGCATYLDQVRLTIAAVRPLRPGPVAPALMARLLDVFRASRSAV